MTNRRRFFYNGILLTLVAVLMRAVSMAFNSYVTRTVGAEGIGLFTLIMTVYSFAVTFATSGISLTTTRLVAESIGADGGSRVKKILRHAVTYSLIFSIFASSVLFFGAEHFAYRVLSDGRAVLPLRVLAVSLVPISLTSVFTGYFIGVKRVAKNATVQLLGQSFRIILTLACLAYFLKGGVVLATVALTLATTLTELFAFLVSLLQFLFDRRRARCDGAAPCAFSEICATALPLALSAYIRSALLTLEHVLIPRRLRDRGESLSDSLSSYGMLHGMALPTLTMPMATLSSFSGLLVPEFAESVARGEHARLRRVASEALNTTLVYSSCMAVFIFLFSEELGYVIYDSYGAGRYIALLSPIIPIMYLDHVTDSMLKGVGEQVYSMWINIADSFLSVVLVYLLIPVMGISGYAVVIAVMEGFNFFFSFVRLKRRIKFKINILQSCVLPLSIAASVALLSKRLFVMQGAEATLPLMLIKLTFALSLFLGLYISVSGIIKRRTARVG